MTQTSIDTPIKATETVARTVSVRDATAPTVGPGIGTRVLVLGSHVGAAGGTPANAGVHGVVALGGGLSGSRKVMRLWLSWHRFGRLGVRVCGLDRG